MKLKLKIELLYLYAVATQNKSWLQAMIASDSLKLFFIWQSLLDDLYLTVQPNNWAWPSSRLRRRTRTTTTTCGPGRAGRPRPLHLYLPILFLLLRRSLPCRTVTNLLKMVDLLSWCTLHGHGLVQQCSSTLLSGQSTQLNTHTHTSILAQWMVPAPVLQFKFILCYKFYLLINF